MLPISVGRSSAVVAVPSKRFCAVCGAPARPPFQAPPPELAPDLDLRPGEPTRSTLARWVHTCRGCGASGPDLAALPRDAAETVRTPDYRALSGPAPERPFLRYALLCEAAGERDEAAGAVLQAAWVLDDQGADAVALRRRAAALWGQGATVQDGLRVLDVLRRAGALEEAAAQLAGLAGRAELEETDRALLDYQRGLLERADTGRHLMSSALRPPAHRPHVTHGRVAKRGFWDRLVGR